MGGSDCYSLPITRRFTLMACQFIEEWYDHFSNHIRRSELNIFTYIPIWYFSWQNLRRHGDIIQRTVGGYYIVQGRADDTMNLGGIKVITMNLFSYKQISIQSKPKSLIRRQVHWRLCEYATKLTKEYWKLLLLALGPTMEDPSSWLC